MFQNTSKWSIRMMKKFIANCFLIFFTSVFSSVCFAEIVRVPFDGASVTTAAWMRTDSKAVLIFLPGGNGKFGIAARDPQKPLWIFQQVFDAKIDIVFMDSEESLGERDLWARRTTEHFKKIKSVVEFFKKSRGKPVFLIGQ